MTNKTKIRTVIIGLGKISWAYEKDGFITKRNKFPTHFSVLKNHQDFDLVAVQDKSVEARTAFRSHIEKIENKPKIYESWREMIKKERPDLLVVASDTGSHVEICARAIDMRVKNILCEKPLSYSLKDAERLVLKAEKKGCNLFVNYFRAFNPSYVELIEKIKNDLLGRIQSFDAVYSRGIFNNGTHLFDLLERIFGQVKSVQGIKNPTCNLSEKDPTISAILKFDNGVSGYIHGLNNDFYNIFELDIFGEFGKLQMSNDKIQLNLAKNSRYVGGYKSLDIKPKKNLIDLTSGLYPVYQNIYLFLKGKEKNKCSGVESLVSLNIADMIFKSSKK
jgi:predicted dehydrogenase